MNSKTLNRPNGFEPYTSLNVTDDKSIRGKLKIFLGMCPGVGKTFGMLHSAQIDREKGSDVIIGYIDINNCNDIEKLIEGLEIIESKKFINKGTSCREVDTNAIIIRHPEIVLIDDLAHNNVPGSRHMKRYQDVMEILDNGIDVYTTVNVTNIESQSEKFPHITGLLNLDTLPDEIFERAEEITLIDVTEEELLKRFADGKIIISGLARETMDNFFQKDNLVLLRQMALRVVGDHLENQLHDKNNIKPFHGSFKSGVSLLVAIDYNQQAIQLLRWGKNLSASMNGEIQAIYVETAHQLSPKEREQLERNINFAKQHGIEFRITTNYDRVKAIIDYAIKEKVTHILVGKPRVRNQLTMFNHSNLVNRLMRYSGNIDVYILGADNKSRDHFKDRLSLPAFTANLSQFLLVTLFVSLTTTVCFFIKDFIGYQSVAFVLLFLISILALFYATGPVLYAAFLSALAWDYFFIYPQFTLVIANPLDVLLLVMFFIIALLNGVLTSRVRIQENKIRTREERTQALYQLTKELSSTNGIEEISKNASFYILKYFRLNSVILLKNDSNQLEYKITNDSEIKLSQFELSVADWVFRYSGKAGKYTNLFHSTEYTFYPLAGIYGNMGVVAVHHTSLFTHGEEQFWEAFLTQISGKFERDYLRNFAQKTYMLNESEKLYNTIFSSISHELRIPVATIMGSSEALLTQGHDEENKHLLYSEINTASVRLNQLIENLLNMSRIESGHITPHPDWCDVLDIANKTIDNLTPQLSLFKFFMQIPNNMPLIYIDSGLIEQVLYNLVLNATQYAPEGTSIRLIFSIENELLTIQVMDRGLGFPENELPSVFKKFYRGKDAKSGGTGLGLSIVKGYVEALKGKVTAENRKNGGAKFTVIIPVKLSDVQQYNKHNQYNGN